MRKLSILQASILKLNFFNVHGHTSWDLGLKGCYVILGTMLKGGNEKPKRNRRKVEG